MNVSIKAAENAIFEDFPSRNGNNLNRLSIVTP